MRNNTYAYVLMHGSPLTLCLNSINRVSIAVARSTPISPPCRRFIKNRKFLVNRLLRRISGVRENFEGILISCRVLKSSWLQILSSKLIFTGDMGPFI